MKEEFLRKRSKPGEALDHLFKNAKKIKPKYHLTAKQMDKLIGDEIFEKEFTTLMSEKALAKDWLRKKENEAWKKL